MALNASLPSLVGPAMQVQRSSNSATDLPLSPSRREEGTRVQIALSPWRGTSTGGGTRTHTRLPSLDFESSASANSATPASRCKTIVYCCEAGRQLARLQQSKRAARSTLLAAVGERETSDSERIFFTATRRKWPIRTRPEGALSIGRSEICLIAPHSVACRGLHKRYSKDCLFGEGSRFDAAKIRCGNPISSEEPP